jgi:hypothetical protein
MLQIEAYLVIVIYDCKTSIVQATGQQATTYFHLGSKNKLKVGNYNIWFVMNYLVYFESN